MASGIKEEAFAISMAILVLLGLGTVGAYWYGLGEPVKAQPIVSEMRANKIEYRGNKAYIHVIGKAGRRCGPRPHPAGNVGPLV